MGHSGGVSTMLVPGAGEPNFDSYVADPFQRRKARQEQEVHLLLDKLQPDMIVLDPTTIGQVSPRLPACCHVVLRLTVLTSSAGRSAFAGHERLAPHLSPPHQLAYHQLAQLF